MSPIVTNSIIVAALSGLISGIAVALLTYFLTRRKTEAEIGNLKAQAAKAEVETTKLLAEVKSVAATVTYSLAGDTEQVLLGGARGVSGFDVKGSGGQFWSGPAGQAKPISPKGEGSLRFEEGMLSIQRTNTAGRFELMFTRYVYKENEHSLIPKDYAISGKRKLLVSCEAKVSTGEHRLRFVIREPGGNRLAEDSVKVSTNTWTPFQIFLTADPTVDSEFRIDDEEPTLVPSSIQIRNISLTQRG